jgi:CBS-domain-containing membrane protein
MKEGGIPTSSGRTTRIRRQKLMETTMTRRDDYLDALVRQLGAAYYQALHGEASAADVSKAVERLAQAERDGGGSPASAQAPGRPGHTGRWRVSDVMTAKVVSVTRHASYKEVAQLLGERHLTALPVIEPDGRIVGVVSEADLLRKQERHEHPEKLQSWRLNPAARTKAEARTAEGLMTSPAVTIGPDALLGTAARLMSAHHVKRLPVVDAEGIVVGIVSRADLLKVFLRPDAEIAAEATDVLTGILLADPDAVQVTAHKGVVTLVGRLASDEQIATAVRLVDAIDGVVAVISKLHAPPPENWPGGGYHIPA